MAEPTPHSSAGETAPQAVSPAENRLTSRADRRPSRRWSARWSRTAVSIAALVLAFGGAAAVDTAVLMGRPARVEIAMPSPLAAAPETWLILGTDSRQTVPDGPNRYGTTEEVPGSRADVVVLIQRSTTGMSVLVIPRDLTLVDSNYRHHRLATSYLEGPQNTVDLLCTTLGVPVSHLVTIDMAQFAQVVDALGGVEVSISEPVRDTYAGLNLTTAGTQHLNGIDALALVRSRHPEVLREGTWTALSETEGSQRRSEFSGLIMRAVLESLAAKARNPLAAHSLAHQVAGDLTMDEGTGILDLLALARSARAAQGGQGIETVTVPVTSLEGSFIATPQEQTFTVLAQHGYAPGTCAPAAP
ncbi:LCP family protein [Actinomyces oricola]|uniref:LCP family protein n=1 Tax=Actinomyces oricola TaxID=206043 RepID=UPI000FFEA879|nr:LCP family protein [Actinomyces oricola]